MLTNTETREFEGQLKARASLLRDSIRSELLASEEQHYVDLAGRVHDSGDEAVADLLTDIDNAIVVRHAEEVREIDAALFRIAQSNYGTCADCSGQIPLARLRASPTARRCFSCQQVHERSFDHAGRASL